MTRMTRKTMLLALAVAVGLSLGGADTSLAAPELTPGGTFTFLAPGEQGPEGPMSGVAAARAGGDVFAAGMVVRPQPDPTQPNPTADVIRRLSPAGTILATFENPVVGGRSSDLDISADGLTLYVAGTTAFPAAFGSLGVTRIDAATGASLGTFGQTGAGISPPRIAVAPNGSVYLLEAGTTVNRYSASGVFEANVPLAQTTTPLSLTVDPRNGDLLVGDFVDPGSHVDRYTAGGTYLSSFGGLASDLAVRPQDGAVYVATNGLSVAVYTSAGTFVKAVAPPGGRFPQHLSARPDGTRLWVTDDEAEEVRWFDASEVADPVAPAPPDTTPPTTTLLAPGDGAVLSDTPTFVFSSNEPGSFECSVDAQAFTACQSPLTLTGLSAGDHTFAVRAVDAAGNRDAAPATVRFSVRARGTGPITNPGGPQPLPAPRVGRTVNVKVISGTVLYRLPGSKTYRKLTDPRQLPIGTILDTRNGRVELTSATGRNGGTQTAQFYDGRFKVTQAQKAGAVTELRLTGNLLCGATSSARAAKKSGAGRKLWGDGKGNFRTKGRNGSATVRGTIWLVQDRCDSSTLFRVRRGVVRVRDTVRKRTITLRAPDRYVARARR